LVVFAILTELSKNGGAISIAAVVYVPEDAHYEKYEDSRIVDFQRVGNVIKCRKCANVREARGVAQVVELLKFMGGLLIEE
jgi:hypothetical protein